MKKLIDYINTKIFVKTVWLHTATVITKITAGVLTTKFIAIFIGAEGLALIGNLRNFLNAIQTVSIVGLYNSFVKYIGEYRDNLKELSTTISTVYYLGFFTTVLICLLCYFNATSINELIFTTSYDYSYVIKILALALPFYSLNMLCFAIMNGFEKYKFLMIINIIGQILGLLITLLLIYQNNIDGALIAVVISPSLIFLITLMGIIQRRNLMTMIKVKRVDFHFFRKLGPMAVMAIVSGIGLPLVMLAIRKYIIKVEGTENAGYWEAMNRISSYYLLFVNSIMTLYFIPRFAEIKSKREFRKEVFSFYRTVMPIFGLGLLVIYLLREFIVMIILNQEFKPVESLFIWQLFGDFVKVLAIVIAYQFIAKRMFLHFIVTELFLFVMLYLSSIYFVDEFGLIGANMGHFISYVVYFLVVVIIFGTSLFGFIEDNLE